MSSFEQLPSDLPVPVDDGAVRHLPGLEVPRVTLPATTGGAIDDSTITAKVKSALIEDDSTKGGDIKVETRGGVVQLSGFVSTEAQKSAATKVAQSVEGVKAVKNGLGIKN